MLDNYRATFRAPGSAAFSGAFFVMRIPIALYPLGLILLISTRTHHYGFAGVLGGVFILGGALGNPFAARAVDRYGQGAVLIPATAGHLVGVAVLVVLAREHAPDWTLLLPTVALGFCYLPVGSMVRARWSYLFDGRPEKGSELATAYSFESTADEVIYIVGPLVATVLATQLDPILVLIVAGVLVGAGATLVVPLRATAPPPHPARTARHPSAMRQRGMVLAVFIAIAMGAIFASAEVAMVAFCGQHHEQSFTGLVLAAMALGSASAGLWYGGRTWHRDLLDRFRLQALVFAVLPWLFLAAFNVGVLAACAFVIGLAIAPSLITLFGLVSQLVASSALTEGLAWALTGINIGYGIGAALVGRVSDAWGARAAFGVTIAAATTMGVLSLCLHARLRNGVGAPVEPVDVG